MFKKLSPALVAISLVAVAQPALAQDVQDVKHGMTIYSKTDNTVVGKRGSTWTYAAGDRKVTVSGVKTTSDRVDILMYCTITGTPTGDLSTWQASRIKNGIIKEISCVPTPDAPAWP